MRGAEYIEECNNTSIQKKNSSSKGSVEGIVSNNEEETCHGKQLLDQQGAAPRALDQERHRHRQKELRVDDGDLILREHILVLVVYSRHFALLPRTACTDVICRT